MVTTRSSTGKLPAARPADPLLTVLDDVNDARRSRQTRVNVKRAVVGGDDRLSRLPWEVLRSILCGCHPWSLIQRKLDVSTACRSNLGYCLLIVSRTSHTFRNYLTSRQSIAVWKAARTSLEVWRRTKKIDTWGHPAYAYSTNKPIKGGSPVLLSCPGPPNGISEMVGNSSYILHLRTWLRQHSNMRWRTFHRAKLHHTAAASAESPVALKDTKRSELVHVTIAKRSSEPRIRIVNVQCSLPQIKPRSTARVARSMGK